MYIQTQQHSLYQIQAAALIQNDALCSPNHCSARATLVFSIGVFIIMKTRL